MGLAIGWCIGTLLATIYRGMVDDDWRISAIINVSALTAFLWFAGELK